jgi:hypothetical protein
MKRVALLGLVVFLCGIGANISGAADQTIPSAGPIVAAKQCGCCGCLRATYEFHSELRSTYGTQFDPRNYDQTTPHYYFGRMRAYPLYYSDRRGFEFHY